MRGYWFRGLVSAPLAEFILNNITGVEFKIPNPESCLLGIALSLTPNSHFRFRGYTLFNAPVTGRQVVTRNLITLFLYDM